MAFLETKNVKIAGLSACVPKDIEENREYTNLTPDEAEKLIASTGIERRRRTHNLCASDLCYEAAEKIIRDLGWKKDSIDALIFVTQSHDYIFPATSCILQDRLGLSEECYTLDIALGCSGWVYGLSVISSLLSTGNMKRGLLLSGEVSHLCSPQDKSTYPLFGDAGTATAVEFDENAKDFCFHHGTDGSGYKAIIVEDGGCRNIPNPKSFEMKEIEPGIIRSRFNTVLDGMDVFSFGISTVPKVINKFLEHYTINKDSIDYFVFHQANLFLNEKIRKKLSIPEERVPYSLKNFGNTSSATIPLTLITELRNEIEHETHSFVGCGFGVGFSWATVAFELDHVVVSDLVEI